MNFNKTLGLILLALGLGIIFYSLYASFNVFTAKTEPPTVFYFSETIAEKKEIKKENQTIEEIQAETVKEVLAEQLKEMIPADYLQKIFNLVVWSFFMGILAVIGSNIAGLGIKLLTAK